MGGEDDFPSGVSRGLLRCLAWTPAVSRGESCVEAFREGPEIHRFRQDGRTSDAAQQKLKILRMEYMRMSSGPNMFPVCHGKSRPFSTARNETAWTYSMPRSLHLGHGECLNIRNVTLQVLRFGFPVLACFRFPDAIFSA